MTRTFLESSVARAIHEVDQRLSGLDDVVELDRRVSGRAEPADERVLPPGAIGRHASLRVHRVGVRGSRREPKFSHSWVNAQAFISSTISLPEARASLDVRPLLTLRPPR